MNSNEKADLLLVTLQALYGNLFVNSLKGLTLTQVGMVATGVISTLSDEQFNRGMAMLNAKSGQGGYCPTIAEFKTWCMAGSWWSVEKAWLAACRFTTIKKINTVEIEGVKYCKDITREAKLALDQVNHLITACRMSEAERLFKTTYEEIVAKAQMHGRQQEWYVPPVMIEPPKIADPKPQPKNETADQIAALTTQLMSEGMKWGDAFKKAQLEIRGYEQPMFGGVA